LSGSLLPKFQSSILG